MDKETIGTVIAVQKQWWLKINTKPVRTHALDGAIFPHIIKVQYCVNGKDYIKRKWIGANCHVPSVGSSVTVLYYEDKPGKAKVLTGSNDQKDAVLLKNKQENGPQLQYMPIGLSIGLAVGAMIDAQKRKDSKEDKEE